MNLNYKSERLFDSQPVSQEDHKGAAPKVIKRNKHIEEDWIVKDEEYRVIIKFVSDFIHLSELPYSKLIIIYLRLKMEIQLLLKEKNYCLKFSYKY